MDRKIKDLSLLLMSLTGWEEDSKKDPGEKIIKSWKGYSFEALNELEEENLIHQTRGTGKIVILTKDGEDKAKELQSKYD